MKKALMVVIAAALVGIGVTPVEAASTAKKKPVATKKKAQRVAAQFKPGKLARTAWRSAP